MAEIKQRIRVGLRKFMAQVEKEELPKRITKASVEAAGKNLVESMRDLISKGISPIRGQGRYPAYLNPKKYPGKKKPQRPVNLFLTGQQLKSLKARAIRAGKGWAMELGYFNEEASVKEKGHKEGAGGQPRRPTLPERTSDFAITLQKELQNFLVRYLQRK
jgi:hypothetical protein